MPRNSYSGNTLQMVNLDAQAAYSYAPTDAIAQLQAIPAAGVGTTLTLAADGAEPSAGDWYGWTDDDGSCGALSPIVLRTAVGTVGGAASQSFVAPRSAGVAIWNAETRNWDLFTSAAGGGGGASAFLVPFTYQSASPLEIAPLHVGSVVVRTAVLITTAFNGAGASVELGTSGLPTEFFAPGDVDVTATGDTFDNPALFDSAVATNVVLVIVPGAGATAGAGLVLCELKL
jgi:hypothetical protein